MTKRKLPPASDWRARDIDDWNVTTFHQFIIDGTRERYGVEYAPGGGGSRSQRWMREKGMLKQAQQAYGNEVLRKFIEMCWREYRTNQPDKYPYPTFSFMYAYMDRCLPEAQAEVEREKRKEQSKENNINDIMEWL